MQANMAVAFEQDKLPHGFNQSHHKQPKQLFKGKGSNGYYIDAGRLGKRYQITSISDHGCSAKCKSTTWVIFKLISSTTCIVI